MVFIENSYTPLLLYPFGDNMKWLIALFMVAALLSVPVVSAKNTTEYTVRPSSGEIPPVSIQTYDSLTQGQTKTYYTNVGSSVNWLEVDLNWGDKTDSLSLTIYTPGSSRIGTYYDSSDGIIDGRIHIDIVPGQGYVEAGQWKYEAYGVSVVGTEDYNFNVAQH